MEKCVCSGNYTADCTPEQLPDGRYRPHIVVTHPPLIMVASYRSQQIFASERDAVAHAHAIFRTWLERN